MARENQLAENFSKQGIAEENYPQFGTNFWGGSPENNYGFGTSNIKQNIENVTNRLNNSINNGQVTTNSDYTVNTESLVGKPSSYFQNNNSTGGWGNNNTSGWNNNTVGFGGNTSNGFNQNTNFSANPSYGTTPVLQNQTPTPWNNPATQVTTVPQYDNYLNATQRIRALRNGENLRLHIDENPDWDGQWAKHCWKWVGKYYVDKYNEEIEKYAKKANLDPDKLRAVMFTENACGNYGSANYWADVLGWSDSQMPMNIQGKTWEDFNGKHYDTKVPEQNIELSALLLKQIENSLDNPTMDRITTVWNGTGANTISPFGGHGQIAYDTKPWLGEKQWMQKLLEFFFENKKK